MEEKKMILTSRKALELMKKVCPSLTRYSADIFLIKMPDWEKGTLSSPRMCFMTQVYRDNVVPERQKDIKGSDKLVDLLVEVEHPE